MLGINGSIKVADFGIARQCRDSVSRLTSQADSGTLLYMSPEQLIGKSNEASDVYSLGVMLYEMLTGEPPFCSGDIPYQIREVIPDPPEGISSAMKAVVMKCLEKKPERRFSSFVPLREELEGKADRKEEARQAPKLAEEKIRLAAEPAQQPREQNSQKGSELRNKGWEAFTRCASSAKRRRLFIGLACVMTVAVLVALGMLLRQGTLPPSPTSNIDHSPSVQQETHEKGNDNLSPNTKPQSQSEIKSSRGAPIDTKAAPGEEPTKIRNETATKMESPKPLNPGSGTFGTDGQGNSVTTKPPSDIQRVGPLEARLLGCRVTGDSLRCEALVTNSKEDDHCILYTVSGDRASRVVDEQGQIYIANGGQFGSESLERGSAQIILPQGVPVQVVLLFSETTARSRGNAGAHWGPNLALVELTFYDNNHLKTYKVQFRNIPVLH